MVVSDGMVSAGEFGMISLRELQDFVIMEFGGAESEFGILVTKIHDIINENSENAETAASVTSWNSELLMYLGMKSNDGSQFAEMAEKRNVNAAKNIAMPNGYPEDMVAEYESFLNLTMDAIKTREEAIVCAKLVVRFFRGELITKLFDKHIGLIRDDATILAHAFNRDIRWRENCDIVLRYNWPNKHIISIMDGEKMRYVKEHADVIEVAA